MLEEFKLQDTAVFTVKTNNILLMAKRLPPSSSRKEFQISPDPRGRLIRLAEERLSSERKRRNAGFESIHFSKQNVARKADANWVPRSKDKKETQSVLKRVTPSTRKLRKPEAKIKVSQKKKRS